MDRGLEVARHPVRAHGRAALEVGDVAHVRVEQIVVVRPHDWLENVPEVLHAHQYIIMDSDGSAVVAQQPSIGNTSINGFSSRRLHKN